MDAALLDRLAEEDEQPLPPRQRLLESIRQELSRLLNTRRSAGHLIKQPNVLDYGIPDWTAMQIDREDDRRRLLKSIRAAIATYEPRLQVSAVELEGASGSRQQTVVSVTGFVRGTDSPWPLAFHVDMTATGIEVRDERLT